MMRISDYAIKEVFELHSFSTIAIKEIALSAVVNEVHICKITGLSIFTSANCHWYSDAERDALHMEVDYGLDSCKAMNCAYIENYECKTLTELLNERIFCLC